MKKSRKTRREAYRLRMACTTRARWLVTAFTAAVLGVGAAPAVAQDTVVVDFESGPAPGTPITDQYRASSFVFWNTTDYNPRRRSAPTQTSSGSFAADVGAEHCIAEGGTPSGCELPVGGTRGRLTRSADAISLKAGIFTAQERPVQVRLEGLNGAGDVVVSTPLTTITTSITTPLQVTRPQGDLLGFRLFVDSGGGVGAAVGFDDLTLTYPAGSLPDLALDAPANTVTVLQQRTLDVPIGVTRINGSNGPADLQVSGLPPGVTGEFVPDPLPGTEETAVLRLTAAPDAPETPGGIPAQVSVTADPQGSAGVAGGPRSTTFRLEVDTQFDLLAGGPSRVGLPVCGTVDVPLRFGRSIGFSGTVHLEVSGLQPGISGTFTPTADLVPAGHPYAGLALRLKAEPRMFASDVGFVVTATSPGAPTRRLFYRLDLTSGTVALRGPADGALAAPARLREGSSVVIESDSWCAGSTVSVGAGRVDDVTVNADGRTLSFRTPRLATSGPITIQPPAGPAYRTPPVTVSTFRSRNGLSFGNYPFTGLSFSEMVSTFGVDDLFLHVNPCWPWGTCPIPTPAPSPTALIAYGIIDWQMKKTGGHCFGISRAVMGWLANSATLNRWTPGTIFDIPGRTSDLDSYLDGLHATQASAEFIRAYFDRSKSVRAQLDLIRSQLQSGNWPLVSLRNGSSGHAMVAYDIVDRADGGADVLLYDNNVPFDLGELTNANDHRVREAERSVLRIAPDRSRWEFTTSGGGAWSGDGSTIFASPRNAIPDNPSLPGLTTLGDGLIYLVFGSEDGSVRSEGAPDGGDLLPLLDDSAEPGSGGVVGGRGLSTLRHVVRGVAAGRYRQAVVGDRSIAAVEAPSAPGVRDAVGTAPGDGVRFTALSGGSAARAVDLSAATAGDGVHRSVEVRTRTARGGSETLALSPSGVATYEHDGPATTVRLSLSGLQRDGGASSFSSGPLRVGRGATVTVRPSSWRTLERVRVTVKPAKGRARVRTLRSRAAAPASLAIGALRVRGRGVTAAVTFGRLPAHRGAGVVLRVVRGRRTLARRVFAIPQVNAGRRTLRWTLPASLRRRGARLRADATLVVGGERTGTVRRGRSIALR